MNHRGLTEREFIRINLGKRGKRRDRQLDKKESIDLDHCVLCHSECYILYNRKFCGKCFIVERDPSSPPSSSTTKMTTKM